MARSGLALAAKAEAAGRTDGTQGSNAAGGASSIPIRLATGTGVAVAGSLAGTAVHLGTRVAAAPVAGKCEHWILKAQTAAGALRTCRPLMT